MILIITVDEDADGNDNGKDNINDYHFIIGRILVLVVYKIVLLVGP